MRYSTRSIAALITTLAVVLAVSPVSAMGVQGGATLEGLVVGVDGTPAAGYRVHLIDESGRPTAEATADEDGLYSFTGVPAGDYALGIENPGGQMAPVAAPPMRLGDNELARRDLKLMSADEQGTQSAMRGNYSLGRWWAGLTPAAKAWTVVALVVVVGVTVALLNDNEASVFEPPAEQPQ